MPAPITTLTAIRDKVRRITGRPSATSITDAQIDEYINTFYLYDFPEHLRLQNLRVNWQFLTRANIPVYDFPKELFLTVMPPVFIAGYQSYMTQSRENFFRINPELNLLKQSVATGTNSSGPYTFTLTPTPILRGFKQNPPGAFESPSVLYPSIPVASLNWNILLTSVDGTGASTSLVDDGLGQLWDVGDTITAAPPPGLPRGSINYLTGAVTATFNAVIPAGTPINAQFVPYKASRPQSACFYQDQISLYPIPDQAYTVSLECYKYPTALLADGDSPQLAEWWQALAYGAADKVFTDNADMDNAAKYRPLLDEQLRLIQRRTLVQQTSERTATIYESQQQLGQYPFGNNFSF
jgi:hypothetical protein